MLKKFFQESLKDQLKIQGEECTICDKIHLTESAPFQAIITTKNSEIQVEIGSIIYNVDAHALIPESVGQEKITGNRLKTKNGEYIITSAVKSLNEAAFSCDLVKIKSI